MKLCNRRFREFIYLSSEDKAWDEMRPVGREYGSPDFERLQFECPCCGAADLIHETRDVSYIYKGEITTIPSVTGDFCPACGEVILTREHGDHYSELLGQFQLQVNASDQGMLAARDRVVESWLHNHVGPAFDALKTDPSLAVTSDQVRARLAAVESVKK